VCRAGLQGKALTALLEKLEVSKTVVLESLRLAPPASMIARRTTSKRTVNGVAIPAGVEVWIPVREIHRYTPAWGAASLEFNPGRWQDRETPAEVGAFCPFGAGARSCIGRHFALLEMTVAVAMIAQRYRFRAAASYRWQGDTFFTGFGLRPFDAATNTVCLRGHLEPHR